MDASIGHAALLGVIQGITEFLPVSSSAHLIVVSWLMDNKPLPLTLNIALHVGTMAALLVYFWRDWFVITKAVIARVTRGQRSFESDTLLPGLVIGSLPAGLLGVLWNDEIEAFFHHPGTTILPLALIGLCLWLADKKMPATKALGDLTIRDATIIGVGQACALIPGFSRSGSTILTARLLKVKREDAARFSFLLGTPAMCGAALLKSGELAQSIGDPIFAVGTLVSFASGCLAISFLMKFLRVYGFAVFAVYRALLAVVIALLVFAN